MKDDKTEKQSDIKDLLVDRRKLENQIGRLVSDFNNDHSGVKVESIFVQTVNERFDGVKVNLSL